MESVHAGLPISAPAQAPTVHGLQGGYLFR